MSAGESKRWTGDQPKQMTMIKGEPLLYRTVRILKELKQDDIYITVTPELKPLLETLAIANKITLFEPKNNVQEIDRFLSCEEVWDKSILFLYGDTFYTKEALQDMIEKFNEPISFYGRRGGNDRKPYGEMFGLRVKFFRNAEYFKNRLNEIRELEIKGEKRGLGWDVYRAYDKKNFFEIDPRVEDFDNVEDVEKFLSIYK